MAIPSEKDIEFPLLREIETAGGEAKPSELVDKVAKHFPQLTSADQELRHPISGDLVWRNRVHWARQHLVNKGEVDASTRGIWKITQKGRERLSPQPPPARRLTLPSISILVQRENQQIRVQLHELLMSLHPQQFEEFAGVLLESVGFTEVVVTRYRGDGGIDGYGNLEMGVVKVKAAFQVKRWRNNIPPAEVNEFRGAIQGEFDQGIFITTSDFSDEAKKLSTKQGATPIVLINGNRIIDIMLDKGLGIRQEPLTVTRIDEEFFAAFRAGEDEPDQES